MRIPLLLLLHVGCVADGSLRIVFDGESQTVQHELDGTLDQRQIGVGVPARMQVVKGRGEDEHTPFAAGDVAVRTLVGATQTPCPGLCIVADGTASTVELELETPEGTVRATRAVAMQLKVSAFTPNWGRAPVDKIHMRANAKNDFRPVIRNAASNALVSGKPATFEVTGEITFEGLDTLAGAPGTATIGAPNLAPLQIKIVSAAESSASIVRFTADRVWTGGVGKTTLTAYTEGPVGEVLFDGFDADDHLALPNLALDVVGGPGVIARAYPVDTVPCSTNNYCFLRGDLPSGVDTLMSYVDVGVGTATQRFDVQVIRGQY